MFKTVIQIGYNLTPNQDNVSEWSKACLPTDSCFIELAREKSN
jgi:hypothetical protein